MATKRCSKCNEEKSQQAFYRKRASTEERQSQCMECAKKYEAAYREAHKPRPVMEELFSGSLEPPQVLEHRKQALAALEFFLVDVESLSLEANVSRSEVEEIIASRVLPVVWNHALFTAREWD